MNYIEYVRGQVGDGVKQIKPNKGLHFHIYINIYLKYILFSFMYFVLSLQTRRIANITFNVCLLLFFVCGNIN